MKIKEYLIKNKLDAKQFYKPKNNNICDLRIDDPDFNKGHGNRFFNAFDRTIIRGDFK